MKWKHEQTATSVEDMRAGKKAATQRIVRARLTLRGFKDMENNDIARYAGTSARSSQKVLVSEAARRNWGICTTDIAEVVLQGVTYEELATCPGEPEREVNFYLPPRNAGTLRNLPGFEAFDPRDFNARAWEGVLLMHSLSHLKTHIHSRFTKNQNI